MRLNKIGAGLTQSQAWDQALACFYKALSLDESYFLTHYNIGFTLYFGKKLYCEAESALDTALRLAPDSSEALYAKGHLLFHIRKDAVQSKHLLEKAAGKDPALTGAYNTLGLIEAGAGRWQEASVQYLKALETSKKHAAALANLGIAYINLNKIFEAIDAFRQSAEAGPENPANHINLGNAYGMAGQFGEAKAAFARALDLSPDNADIRFWLGCILLEENLPEDAVQALQESLALKPIQPLAHYNLAMAYDKLRLETLSKTHMDRAIELMPAIGKDLV